MLRVDLYLLTPIRFLSMRRDFIFMTAGQCPYTLLQVLKHLKNSVAERRERNSAYPRCKSLLHSVPPKYKRISAA
jgi:hypothetical protein